MENELDEERAKDCLNLIREGDYNTNRYEISIFRDLINVIGFLSLEIERLQE